MECFGKRFQSKLLGNLQILCIYRLLVFLSKRFSLTSLARLYSTNQLEIRACNRLSLCLHFCTCSSSNPNGAARHREDPRIRVRLGLGVGHLQWRPFAMADRNLQISAPEDLMPIGIDVSRLDWVTMDQPVYQKTVSLTHRWFVPRCVVISAEAYCTLPCLNILMQLYIADMFLLLHQSVSNIEIQRYDYYRITELQIQNIAQNGFSHSIHRVRKEACVT